MFLQRMQISEKKWRHTWLLINYELTVYTYRPRPTAVALDNLISFADMELQVIVAEMSIKW